MDRTEPKTTRPGSDWQRPKRFDRNLVVIGAGSAGLVSAYIAAAAKAKAFEAAGAAEACLRLHEAGVDLLVQQLEQGSVELDSGGRHRDLVG